MGLHTFCIHVCTHHVSKTRPVTRLQPLDSQATRQGKGWIGLDLRGALCGENLQVEGKGYWQKYFEAMKPPWRGEICWLSHPGGGCFGKSPGSLVVIGVAAQLRSTISDPVKRGANHRQVDGSKTKDGAFVVTLEVALIPCFCP